jgi:GT2 family glycosyltransferase/glycosyltransferase involved in cell wall biosynthesis
LRTTIEIDDPLFISAPNNGGLLYMHRQLLVQLLGEDVTGLSLTPDGLMWCVQTTDQPLMREVRDGQLRTIRLGDQPLDLHDVLVDGKNTYVVLTQTNQVVMLDDKHVIQERWSFGDEPDSVHINCMAIFRGRLIASTFGAFSSHRGYKGATQGAGTVIDVRTGDMLISGLSQPHSLVVAGNELWLCSSEDRLLLVHDEHFQLQRKVALPGYARGLAIGAEHVYVGISRSRNLQAGEAGQFSAAAIAVLDRSSLEIKGYVPIPWNEVYDIRIAVSPERVNQVMAATWGQDRERAQTQARHDQQLLAKAGQRIRQNEGELQTLRDIRAHMDRELAATNAFRESEVARLTQQLSSCQSLADAETARLTQQLSSCQSLADAETVRLTQLLEVAQNFHASELARMAQAVSLAEAAGDREIQRQMQQAERTNAALEAAIERAETLQAQVIEVRGELIRRDARLHALQTAQGQLDAILTSRSWRLTRPMRFAMRVLHNRGFGDEDLRRLKGQPPHLKPDVRQTMDVLPSNFTELRNDGETGSPVTEVGPVSAGIAPPGELRDFFVWAVIDWHFRIQRPQHLARELAKAGHRVFYISNNFIDRPDAGFNTEALDSDGRLFQINLHLKGSPAIYHGSPDASAIAQLQAGLGMLLVWTRSRSCASLVQHPYWLEVSRCLPNQRLVYDCMDHHGGFADNTDEVLAREHELMRDADLLVVTSDWLDREAGQYNPHRLMIRNACQYEHFCQHPEQVFEDSRQRKIIGYYGAIAEWFDLELLEKLARRFSDCLVLMVGADTCGARARLQGLENVLFTGEVPYAELPYYLGAFDVCLLPFQVIPLTLATNPVKIYEYLSAGKDVVSIDLPEIRQFGDLVRTGSDHPSFIAQVGQSLDSSPDPQMIARRQRFAAEQTWAHRVDDLVRGIEAISLPRVSVVVVTYNNLDLTKACLHSLQTLSDYANLETIVVDNASADDTQAYLREWVAAGPDRQIILNEDNRGFAAANNQGLEQASGDYLVMLNNDTYVTAGWVATLVGHLRHSRTLGMLGPVTNNIGNEARIDINYSNMEDMALTAGDYTRSHAGQLTPLRTAAFFCVMMPRAVYEKVGPLDEAFGVGFFEDDDYCRRVEQAGWTIACADDVFVHHNLSASFNKLKHETRQALFERNKALYEARWGEWIPHQYRKSP